MYGEQIPMKQALMLFFLFWTIASRAASAAGLETDTVALRPGSGSYVADAVIEAVRQSTLAAQVAGRITELAVRAGDRVAAGQVLMRIDATYAAQQAASGQAQVAQARAMLDSARSEYERSKRLYGKEYLSAAAMERAEAQFKSSAAQAEAMIAQANAASTQTGFHTVRAPYAGWVADVAVERGDMAMPGRNLITVYDPSALRATAQVPESVLPRLKAGAEIRVELPNAPEAQRWQTARKFTVLPVVDAVSHSASVRADLPAGLAGVMPGQFARVHLPASGGEARVSVPKRAVVMRGEVVAVYVVNAEGHARLRQVHLGRESGDRIEILAGLAAGERIALDPVAAAAQR
jgi:RND family efflux transporter MFP subunit